MRRLKLAVGAGAALALGAGLIWALDPGSTGKAPCTEREWRAMTTAERDMEALGRLIHLDPPPQEVHWQTCEWPGGGDWQLVALLAYNSAQAAVLRAAMPAQGGSFDLDPPGWLPAEMRASAPGEQGRLVFAETLEPAPFRRSPLLTGYAVPVGETGFLIVLWTQ